MALLNFLTSASLLILMEYFTIGEGEKIPALGLGTWRIGGGFEPDHFHDALYLSALRLAFNLGYRLIDTAEVYAGGHAEELIGEALKGFPRDEFFIVTKVWSDHLHHDEVLKAARGSLKRLRLKYVDLYLIHWPNPSVPIQETIRAMERLVEEGKTRYIGVSNFSVKELQEAMYSTRKYEIVANQVKYSVLHRQVERDLLPFARKSGIRIIAYTPLEKGSIQADVLSRLSKKYGKTPIQVALNYLLCQEAIPIPKAVKKEHLEENLGALGWRLDWMDVELIRRET